MLVKAHSHLESRFIAVPAGFALSEMVTELLGSMDPDSLVIEVCGEVVPQKMWDYYIPHPDTKVEIYHTVHGGSRKGGKNIIALLLTVAVVAFAAFITAGGAAPLLGELFAAKTLGAAMLGAAVGLGGQLAIAALFPPTKPKEEEEEKTSITNVDAGSNILGPGTPLPYIAGERRINPPMITYPHYYLQDDHEMVEVVFAVAGPAKWSEIKVGNNLIEDMPEVEYEIVEGWADDPTETFITRYSKPVSVNETLENFKVKGVELVDQDIPSNSEPKPVRLTSKGKDPHELLLRIHFSNMINVNNTDVDVRQPMRIRMRLAGTSTWRNLPEIHWHGHKSVPFLKEIRFRWAEYVANNISFVITGVDSPSAYVTPEIYARDLYATVPQAGAVLTVGSPNPQWQCDAYFDNGAGLRDTIYINGVEDGLEVFLDDTWDKGIYEFEILCGMLIRDATFNAATYVYNSQVRSFFYGYMNTGTDKWQTAITQEDFQCQVTVVSISSIWKNFPVRPEVTNVSLLAVRSRGVSIDKLSALVGSYVPDWDGIGWNNWIVTKNPSPHYRHVCIGHQQATPVTEASADDETLIAWRQSCIDNGYEVNAVINSAPSGQALELIASAGFAIPRKGSDIGVVYNHDTTSEYPVQTFSPRNSESITWNRMFNKMPSSIIATFEDETNEYVQGEIEVASPFAQDVAAPERITYDGITKEDVVRKRALFDIYQMHHRKVTYEISTGLESIVCRKGNIIGIATDILETVIAFGRILSVAYGSGKYTLTLDNQIQIVSSPGVFDEPDLFDVEDVFSLGSDGLGIAIMTPEGYVTRPILSATGYTVQINDIPTLEDATTLIDQHVIIGQYGNEVLRAIVKDVTMKEDLKGIITAVPEAPEIQEALNV